MLRLELPPRGSLAPNSDVDPLKYYYAPVIGRVFRARIDLGLSLLDGAGRYGRLLDVSKAERLFEFKAKVGLREGLERTVAWFRAHVVTQTPA